jgi:hypothetical protein
MDARGHEYVASLCFVTRKVEGDGHDVDAAAVHTLRTRFGDKDSRVFAHVTLVKIHVRALK